MRTADKSPVTRHRERRRQQGLVRVEVQVRREDAPLLRRVAGALGDPARAEEARKLLRQGFAPRPGKSLKELLAEAPLEGIDLERSEEPGRDVEL